MKCSYCDYDNDDLKRFSDHVKKVHGKSSEQYTIDVFHSGIKPVCVECGKDVRYVSYSFKRYCKDHSRLAMIKGGYAGGKADAWNKGKTKSNDTRVAAQSKAMTGSGNHFYGRKHTQATVDKISLSKTLASSNIEQRILERQHEFVLMTPLEEYRSRQQQYLAFKCVTCGTVQPKTLQAFERGSRCYVCAPVSKSNWELDVFDYVKEMFPDAKTGDRVILSPKEIDVFVPSRMFGIECHGLYWHSEGSPHGANKKGHLEKLELATSKGVRLIQLFYDEWRDKRAICESMINHRLNIQKISVGARKCKVINLNTSSQREFFDSSHISGYTQSSQCFGLEFESKIIAALSVRKPRQQKYENCYEIARFATFPDTNVIGGLSKLLCHAKRWCIEQGTTSLMTYVDRRIGDGHGYTACGFKLIGNTGVDYFYTDNDYRYDRFKFRASREMTENQVAAEAKVSKIWGCGSLIMELSFDAASLNP